MSLFCHIKTAWDDPQAVLSRPPIAVSAESSMKLYFHLPADKLIAPECRLL